MRRLALLLLLCTAWAAEAVQLSVEISGVEGELADNVRAFLALEREKDRDNLSEARIRLLHRQAPEQIRRALQPFGYFQPEVQASLEKTADGLQARYQITPGSKAKVAEVDLRILGPGRNDPNIPRDFPIRAGDELNQADYDKAKQGLLSRALAEGYLDARFSVAELRVDLDRNSATVRLHLETGEDYLFGDVAFEQEGFDEAFLRRYLRFRPGQPFEHEKLLELQSNLLDSQYFSGVEVRTLRDEAVDNRVPVEVVLSPNKPNLYRAGIGFATDTGPRVTFDWTRRYIGDQGHRMRTELSLAMPRSSFEAEYIIPLERPSRDSLSFGAGADYYDTDSRKGVRYGINAAHNVGLENDWRRTLGLDFLYEDFEIGEDTGFSYTLVPNIGWSRLRSDGLEFIQRGQRLNFTVLGALEPILSNTSFLQGYSNEKFIYGLGGDWRLLARAELGATWAESVEAVPGSRRFFAGGDNSIRGYTLDQLGPADDTGQVIGGRFLAVGSIEVERRLQGKWSAALFYDFGNAFDPDYDNELAQGAGFGVRWRSPVGPVRVDLASALSKDGNPWRLHLVVGPEL
jgi:translocation and assembly module TamA